MVGKVCNLVNGFCLILILARNDDLGGFLAHLFEDLVHALGKQIGGIRALGHLFASVGKQRLQRFKRERLFGAACVNKIVKAGLCARVACGAILINKYGQGIAVTVRLDAQHVLAVARGLALSPKLLSGARPKAGSAFVHGDL